MKSLKGLFFVIGLLLSLLMVSGFLSGDEEGPAKLLGVVRDHVTGEGIKGVEVTLMAPDMPVIRQRVQKAVTDDQGRFKMTIYRRDREIKSSVTGEVAYARKFYISCRKEGYYDKNNYPGTWSDHEIEMFPLEPGRIHEVETVLYHSGSVRIQLLKNIAGEVTPFPRCSLSLMYEVYSQDSSNIKQMYRWLNPTNEDGVSFTGEMPPGLDYSLVIGGHTGKKCSSVKTADGEDLLIIFDRQIGPGVEIVEGQTTELEYTVDILPSGISGRIIDLVNDGSEYHNSMHLIIKDKNGDPITNETLGERYRVLGLKPGTIHLDAFIRYKARTPGLLIPATIQIKEGQVTEKNWTITQDDIK